VLLAEHLFDAPVNIMSDHKPRKRLLATAVVAYVLGKRKKVSNEKDDQVLSSNRSIWTRDWLLDRQHHGHYHALLPTLRLTDPSAFRNFLRMDAIDLEFLIQEIGPRVERMDTDMRPAIPVGERLALTLRFLASGNY
jgi:hypothetical protein